MPLVTTNVVIVGIGNGKHNGLDVFSVQVICQLENTLEGGKYEVCRHTVSYEIRADHHGIDVNGLYALCKKSVDVLAEKLRQHGESFGTPGGDISCPPLANLGDQLHQSIINF